MTKLKGQSKNFWMVTGGIVMIMAVAFVSFMGLGYEKAVAGGSCCGGNSVSGSSNVYGQAISGNSAVTIKELQNNKSKYMGEKVKVTGKVTEVCQKMGCWFYVDDGTGSMYVILGMDKDSFSLPLSSVNSPVVVEGVLGEKDGELLITGSGVRLGN